MKRNWWKIGLGVVVILGGLLVGASAIAGRHRGPGMRHEMMKQHVAAMIDDALDAAKATPAQRARIAEARDRTFAALGERHRDRRADMQQAIALFEADTLDNARIAEMRGRHEAEAKQAGDTIVQAIQTAHDTLSAPQRKAVADYVRAKRPGGHMARFRGEMMKRMATAKVDEALDAVGANAAQRQQIEAARDQLIATLDALHPAEGLAPHMDKALALFEADRIDNAAVAALRAEHEAKMKQVADAVVQALHDVHDALTPAQRHQLVEWVKAQHGRFGHGPGPGMFGPGGPGDAHEG